MDPAPDLLDQLVGEFAPLAAKLASPDAYWLGLQMWMVDRLVGPAMTGETTATDLRRQVWPIYATAYWCCLEIQKLYGVPVGVQKLGFSAQPPTEEFLQGFADKLAMREAALAKGGAECLRVLPEILREEPTTGALHGMAYNAGYVVTIAEDPPLGQRPKHLKIQTGELRINSRDFMRVDYGIPSPDYLKQWRTRFEAAVLAHPDAYEQIIVGQPGEKNLRDLWHEAVIWGHHNWGADVTTQWVQGPYQENVRYSVILNFPLEAVSLAAFVALLNGDEEAAERAVLANALILGCWGPAVMGLLDTDGALPKVVQA
jgi:hypothetical protein